MIKAILNKLEEISLLVLLISICLVMVLQVFFRYVAGYPLIWSEELARFLLVWLTLLGSGYAVRKNLHIEMPYFFDKFPEKTRYILQILINLLCISFFIYLIPYSLETVIRQHNLTSTSLGIPLSYLYIAVPIGFSILILRLIEHTIKVFKELFSEKVKGGN